MKRAVKFLSLAIMVVMLVLTALSGCGSNGVQQQDKTGTEEKVSNSTSAEASDIDLSKEVTLKGYLLGDAPGGMQAVLDKLNERLKKDVNVKMDITNIGWGDFNAKYPLICAAGDQFDWIYTGTVLTNYSQYVAKNAFKEFDMEMVKKYMPKYFAATPAEAWKDATIDGKIYMLPQPFGEMQYVGFNYREDLRKKYGVPEINKFTDLEAYFDAIKRNEKDMIPYNPGSDEVHELFKGVMNEMCGYGENGLSIAGAKALLLSFDIDDPTNQLLGMTDEKFYNGFLSAAKWMKSMYDKGYIAKNPFANKTQGHSVWAEGKTAIWQCPFEATATDYATADSKGWEIKFLGKASPGGKIPARSHSANGIAISPNNKNVERTLMAMDLIFENPSYVYLEYFGVDGKNYVVTADDKIGLPEGLTGEQNDYPLYASGFWFPDRNLWKPMKEWNSYFIDTRKSVLDNMVPNAMMSFTPNYDSVKTELANVENIITQYQLPLMIGMSKDPEADTKILLEKMKTAGLEKVLVEVRGQADAFLAERK